MSRFQVRSDARRAARRAACLGAAALGLLAVGVSSSSSAPSQPCADQRETLCGDGGPAVKARLLRPLAVAENPAGGFYVADAGNHAVRGVSAAGAITTVAGLGTPGYSGDHGRAIAAQLDGPADVSAAADGGLLIADTGNNVIRRVGPGGTITTVAGLAPGTTGQPPGTSEAPAGGVQLSGPQGVAALPEGGFLIADTGANLVLRVSPQGLLATVAGTGAAGSAGDGGAATAAQLSAPTRVLPTPDGGFLVLDSGNKVVRRVTAAGVISTVPGSATSINHGLFGGLAVNPGGLAADAAGDVFVFDNRQVVMVSPAGARTVVAGSGNCGSTGDGGDPLLAELATPSGIALAPGGGLLVSDVNDAGNAAGNVRLVTPGKTIATVAGVANTSSACVGAGGAPSGALWPIFYITAPRDARAGKAITIQFATTRASVVRTSLLFKGQRIRTVLRQATAGLNAVKLSPVKKVGFYTMQIASTGSVANNNADEGGTLELSKRFNARLQVRK